MISDRLFDLIRSVDGHSTGNFPPTEVFNETWMLRLVLDAAQSYGASLPFAPVTGAGWFSEALLLSPFKPARRADNLGEGFTNADAVVGHFDFDPASRAGLRLSPDCTQFVVVEAKMFSGLSAGTKNAPTYNQAARNVACMATAIQLSGQALAAFKSIGFFVIAPTAAKRSIAQINLEALLEPASIRTAVERRIGLYDLERPREAELLRGWQAEHFVPLVEQLVENRRLGVLTWEDCIAAVVAANPSAGSDLQAFYEKCLTFRPRLPSPGKMSA